MENTKSSWWKILYRSSRQRHQLLLTILIWKIRLLLLFCPLVLYRGFDWTLFLAIPLTPDTWPLRLPRPGMVHSCFDATKWFLFFSPSMISYSKVKYRTITRKVSTWKSSIVSYEQFCTTAVYLNQHTRCSSIRLSTLVWCRLLLSVHLKE